MVNNPDDLCNEDIQMIGEKQLHAGYSKILKSALAINLQTYSENNSPYEKWLFLAKNYKLIFGTDSIIAVEIRNIFSKAFNLNENYVKQISNLSPSTASYLLIKIVNDYFQKKIKPVPLSKQHLTSQDQLTNEMIQRIGIEYLLKHGEQPIWVSSFFPFHTNHAIAKKLKGFNEDNSCKRWLFLASIYSMLPNCRGEIAKEIITLFKNGFKSSATELETINFLSKPNEVAIDLRTIIKARYSKQELQTNLNPKGFFSRIVGNLTGYVHFNALSSTRKIV